MVFANRTMRFIRMMGIVAAGGALMAPPAQANTPWGLLASRVIGQVRQLNQKPADDGARSARITVIDLGTRVAQIFVASAIEPGEASATPRIVSGILKICQAMKVTCSAR